MSGDVGQLPSWRLADPEQFTATVQTAAADLGVQPLAVEKDYWVCEALRAIAVTFPGVVVFKGGTSLEKLRLIRRFSEDLDLLIVGNYPNERQAKRAMKEMCRVAAEATGAAESEPQSGGKMGTLHRRAYLNPPLRERPLAESAIADPSAVLLELGQSGGRNPAELRPVSSLLARQLEAVGFPVAEHADLAQFNVQILHPGRTLLEKLLRVNNFAVDPDGVGPQGWSRIGRQFYDIWALLGDDAVQELLAQPDVVTDILASCQEISEHFGGDQPMPEGGFANCVAFAAGGSLASRLQEEHARAMRDFYYGDDQGPTFGDVLDRVHANADVLRCHL